MTLPSPGMFVLIAGLGIVKAIALPAKISAAAIQQIDLAQSRLDILNLPFHYSIKTLSAFLIILAFIAHDLADNPFLGFAIF